MSPSSSLPTFRTSHTSILDRNNGSDQSHSLKQDESPSLKEKLREVQLEPEDDPQQFSLCRRWLAVATISGAGLCVACASSIASICDLVPVLGVGASCLDHLHSLLSGFFDCRRRGTTISCGKRSSDLGYQLICHRSRHRPSLFRTAFGSIWPKHHLSCVIHSLFRLYIPGCFCS